MESKKPEQPSTWQSKDGRIYQDGIRSERDRDEPDGSNTFPFRIGDRVAVKSRDTVWDDDGREKDLVVGWEGTVTEVFWDRTWTTHVMVEFPETGPVVVGWDVLDKII